MDSYHIYDQVLTWDQEILFDKAFFDTTFMFIINQEKFEIYICIHRVIRIHEHTCIRKYTNTYAHIRTYVHLYTHTHAPVYIHTSKYITWPSLHTRDWYHRTYKTPWATSFVW